MAFKLSPPPDGVSKLIGQLEDFIGRKFRSACADRMALAAQKIAREGASKGQDPWGKKWRKTKEDKRRGRKSRPPLPGIAGTLHVRNKGAGFELYSSAEHAILFQKTRRHPPKAFNKSERKYLGLLVSANKLRKLEAEANKRNNGGKYKRSPWRLPARPIFPVYGKPIPETWTKALLEAAGKDGLEKG